MKLVAAKTPSGDADLSQWIEHQVVAEQFGGWITELTAISHLTGVAPKVDSLEAVLGGHLGDVLENGLNGVPREQLRILLQCPQLLVELQRQVFIAGSNHWNAVLKQQVMPSEVEWQRTRIALFLGPEAVVLSRKPLDDAPNKRSVTQRMTVTAVGVLIALGLFVTAGYWASGYLSQQQAINSEWSLQKESQVLSHADAGEYLSGLALFAEQWYSVRPQNEAQLKLRLGKLKSNIQTLIDGLHPPLKKDDQKWIKEMASKWLQQCDDILSRASDVNSSMAQADALCVEMIDALYRRSAYSKR